MYKISPSMLESFRAFKLDLYDTSLEDFIKQVKGEFKATPQMSFGKEIHKFFEDGSPGTLEQPEIDQLTAIANVIPDGINEMFHSQILNGIKFNMVFDRIIGREIHELKITGRFQGIDYYEASVQWKLYLLGSGCDKITYHIITHTEARPCKFNYIKPFSFIPYKGMLNDVSELAADFIDFCKYYQIDSYITVGPYQKSNHVTLDLNA